MSEHVVRRTGRIHAISSIVVGLANIGIAWAAQKWWEIGMIAVGGLLVALGVALLVHPLMFERVGPDEA